MNNIFSPSRLPGDTVIVDKKEGVWIKEESGVWGELVPEDGSVGRTITDDYNIDKNTSADEFFTDFEVIAWPHAVLDYVITRMDEYTDSLTILEEAVDYVVKEQRKEANFIIAPDWKKDLGL